MKIRIIKVLPHLIPLFLEKNGSSIYSTIYSQEILLFFQNLDKLKSSEIRFSNLLKFFQKLSNNSKSNLIKRVDKVVNKLEYSIKGDIIIFWPVGYEHPIKFEFFDEICEKISIFDQEFGKNIYEVNEIFLSDFVPTDRTDIEAIFIGYNTKKDKTEVQELVHIFTRSSSNLDNTDLINLDFQYSQLFYSRFDILEKEMSSLESRGYQIYFKTNLTEDLPEQFFKYLKFNKKFNSIILDEKLDSKNFWNNIVETKVPAGFISENLKFAYLTDRELYGSIYLSKPEKSHNISHNIKKLLRQFEGKISVGDFVVHEDYGVALYAGLKQEEIDKEPMDYLLLKYWNDDEVYVPIYQIEKITKYIGSDNGVPKLTKLGRTSWADIKRKVKKGATILARELVEHYAKREISKATPVEITDSKDYIKFVNEFKFIETEDQLRAVNEIEKDLSRNIPMNRLLIGDVGFGKTEVFMRSIFKIVENGGQVAVLAPTTILTSQHYTVFKERFKNSKFRINYLSRFNTAKTNLEIIDKLNNGEIDIVIGTHRLLSSDIKFKSLQLLVIDEEQRFGVKQKEKIKTINYGVHVLSVSATPIPRTLSMALSSIQDMSIILQAPTNRKPIITEVVKDDWNKITKAMSKEIERGGQIYFIHNEIKTIFGIEDRLKKLLPGIRFIIAHAQMLPSDLDRIMTEFYAKKFDCLIATTIIENGLDLPNVNTIIINKANRFGLTQLYQLRGRVGRSDKQSYCYLLYEGKTLDSNANLEFKEKSKKYLGRLETIAENQDLGSGFRVSSKDMEIRGSGNILGEEQSGNISVIGYALYIEMLAQEVEKIKSFQ